MTQRTNDQHNRCEQIARELMAAGPSTLRAVPHDYMERIAASLLAAEERGRQEQEAEEGEAIGEFQDEARQLIIEKSGAPDNAIDGKGSDAGWQEFTLCEIGQGFNWLIENHQRVLNDAIADRDAIIDALKRQQQREPTRECMEIATRIISETCYEAPELNDPSACIANADRMKQAIAAVLQAERDKLAAVEESARRVIEQAVQVLATRPITGERHTVLTELEAWLNEHPRKETNE